MSETCFTPEVYALYAIGSLDDPERGEFEVHFRRGCDVCRAELKDARRLWFAYGSATAGAVPRPQLRQRILEAARGDAAPRERRLRLLWWQQAAAALLLLGVGVAVGWRLHRVAPSTQAPPLAQVTTPPPVEQAEAENRALKARIAELDRKIAEREQALRASAGELKNAADLQQAVARLQAEGSRQVQALQQAQTRAGQLEAEARTLREQTATADSRARDADLRAQAAANERRQALDREARLRDTTTAQIRDLEAENQRLRQVVDEQERRLQQGLQMASFFASPNLRFYQYKGTRNGPAATAHVIAQEGSRVLFYAFHMPQLPAGRTYQLWLIRGQSPAIVSGGTFNVDRDGNAVVQFANPALIRDVRQYAVTDEPAGGSPGPTGNQFLRGL